MPQNVHTFHQQNFAWITNHQIPLGPPNLVSWGDHSTQLQSDRIDHVTLKLGDGIVLVTLKLSGVIDLITVISDFMQSFMELSKQTLQLLLFPFQWVVYPWNTYYAFKIITSVADLSVWQIENDKVKICWNVAARPQNVCNSYKYISPLRKNVTVSRTVTVKNL